MLAGPRSCRFRVCRRVRTVMVVNDSAGWVFPPGEGSRMHHTAPDRPGSTWCGRPLDPAVPVYAQVPRRAFSICVGCRDAGAEYPVRSAQPAPAPLPLPLPARAPAEGRAPGWVELLAEQGVLHRPDPRVPDRVLCGLVLPGSVPIHRRPPRHWPPCPRCQEKLGRRVPRRDQAPPVMPARARRQVADRAARRRDPRPVAAPAAPVVSARIRARLTTLPVVLGDGPSGKAGTWRLPVGWVRLRGTWHRPHPDRPYWVMCELALPGAASIYRQRTTDEPACPDCLAIRDRALSELRARDRQQEPLRPRPPEDRRPRSAQPPRLQIVRGGLPGLGRDR